MFFEFIRKFGCLRFFHDVSHCFSCFFIVSSCRSVLRGFTLFWVVFCRVGLCLFLWVVLGCVMLCYVVFNRSWLFCICLTLFFFVLSVVVSSCFCLVTASCLWSFLVLLCVFSSFVFSFCLKVGCCSWL